MELVSIPNGMEFYTSAVHPKNFRSSFNSQRDGILHLWILYVAEFCEFQFPTGWNSTQNHAQRGKNQHCFNSQRDGILRCIAKPQKGLRIIVSIPNGMEFYTLLKFPVYLVNLFQFPTGWNSTGLCDHVSVFGFGFNSQRDGILQGMLAKLTLNYTVSIPNEMEFYIILFSFSTFAELFQFPTGWNSTRCWAPRKSVHRLVSIPNRMEFYDKEIFRQSRSVAFQFPTGWNSTGIFASIASLVSSFQFPTGWNSTLATLAKSSKFSCFNSQRDGILLVFFAAIKQVTVGFNSQRDGILRLGVGRSGSFIRMFQFPTGWNSTLNVDFIGFLVNCFNSQRDGILRSLTRLLPLYSVGFNSQRDGILLDEDIRVGLSFVVSIPNGMEFYQVVKLLGAVCEKFQFPTGWNSTHSKRIGKRLEYGVSIPNGMEFYST